MEYRNIEKWVLTITSNDELGEKLRALYWNEIDQEYLKSNMLSVLQHPQDQNYFNKYYPTTLISEVPLTDDSLHSNKAEMSLDKDTVDEGIMDNYDKLTTREMCEQIGINYDEATQWNYHSKNIDNDLEVRTILRDNYRIQLHKAGRDIDKDK
jgi:hypothetical protein